MAFLFSLLDWKIIKLTRFEHPEWKDWMHTHEKTYASIKRPLEIILCTPCLMVKPLFDEALKKIDTTEAEEEAITHAPPMSWYGFYRPVKRGEPYKFTSWVFWFVYWLAPSLLWYQAVKFLWRVYVSTISGRPAFSSRMPDLSKWLYPHPKTN